MQSRPSRPTGITLIAVLVILVGVIGLLFSLAIFALSALVTNFGGASVGTVGTVIAGIFLFFSLIYLLVGRGCLGGKGWAWTLGMIFSILSLVGSVGGIAVGQPGGVGGLLIWGLVIYYLTRPRVKAFFGKGLAIAPSYPLTPQYGQPPMTTNYPGFTQPATSPSSLTFAPLPPGESTPLSHIGSGFSPSPGQPSSSSTLGTQAILSCPNCGSRLATGQNKCPACGTST